MKKMILGSVGMLSLCMVSMAGSVLAAELLDVKPVISGSNVSIEITADIPMTYTYYKVPGQARAVVDIADADPEKVEPLIVVNKGAVASISVDKAMISDMTVSRLVFNLVSESDIQVKQDAGRKKLVVSFGGDGKSAAVSAPVAAPKPAPVAVIEEPVVAPEPKKVVEVVAAPPQASPLSKEEEDPLGLDEPKAAEPAAARPAIAERTIKLEPVVPVQETVAVQSLSKAVVKGMVIGSSYIDIQTNGNIDKIKQMKLVKPDRLVIDIPGVSKIAVKSIAVNKFGIAKVRFGNNPGTVRIVLDAVKSPFPAYTVESSEAGVRINFK